MNVIDIVREGVQLYKNNVKILILISLIEVLIGISSKVLLFFYDKLSGYLTYGLGSIISLLIMYIQLYFSSRLMVTMILAISYLLNNEETNISKCYRESKDIIWRFIGSKLLYFLAVCIPLIVVFWGFNSQYTLMIKVSLIIIGAIPLAYIGTNYYFVSFGAVLKKEEKALFRFSKKLVKGNLGAVMFIVTIPLILQSPLYIKGSLLNVDQVDQIVRLGFQVVTSIYTCIIFPFNIGLAVIAMRKLENESEKINIENVT